LPASYLRGKRWEDESAMKIEAGKSALPVPARQTGKGKLPTAAELKAGIKQFR